VSTEIATPDRECLYEEKTSLLQRDAGESATQSSTPNTVSNPRPPKPVSIVPPLNLSQAAREDDNRLPEITKETKTVKPFTNMETFYK